MTAALMLAVVLTAVPDGGDYAALLKGKRLVHNGASCAGWSFGPEGRVRRYDEMVCGPGDEPSLTARMRWISQDSFVLIETNPTKQECPPRTWLYKVEAIGKDTAKLRSIWTGWGTGKDAIEEYRLRQS